MYSLLTRTFRFYIRPNSPLLAIKGRLSELDWDSPQQVLLSMATLVENHMGGTSGAVSCVSIELGIFLVTRCVFKFGCHC